MAGVFTSLQRLKDGCLEALTSRLTRWTKPLGTSLPLQTLADLGRSKSELIAENAHLRQQLIILRQQVKRPACAKTDRMLLVLLGRNLETSPAYRPARHEARDFHWELFRLYWKRKSKASSHQHKIAEKTITLIRQMAKDNRLWGAERIRGGLLKLGLRVCKRTIQKYMRGVRTQQPRGQRWSTDLTHSRSTDLGMRFLAGDRSVLSTARRPSSLLNGSSRKIIHVGVTRSPVDAWVTQQLREATPYGQAPKYLIRDNDSKFGPCFARVARTSGIKLLKTAYHAPRANAVCERFLRSVRQERLDHLLMLQERQHEPRIECGCDLLQQGATASRNWATDS
jgi:transposase InsO family protein